MSHPGGQPPQGDPRSGPQQGYPAQPGSPQGFAQPGPPGSPQGFAQPGPGQPGSPQGFAQPGPPGSPYPGQPAAPQGYGQQPGYPQPGYGQPGYQPQYPHQQYPQQQQGYPPQQRPAGPLTLPGWGAAPAILGVIVELVAVLAVPWISFSAGPQSVTLSFLDLFKRVNDIGASGLAAAYVHYLAFIVVAATAVSVLPWTLGGLRAKRSAYLLSGIRSRDLTRANFWWYRTVFGGRAIVMFVIHLLGIGAMYWGAFSQLGLGPILLLVGAVLVIAGAFLGPRQGPAMP